MSELLAELEKYGYRGRIARILAEKNIRVYDRVAIFKNNSRIEGILMPKPELSGEDIVILKLDNGYNVGLSVNNPKQISLVARGKPSLPIPPPKPILRKGLPKVSILGTGGTIASRVDYKTGAVYPAFNVEDLYNLIPELGDLADLSMHLLFNIFSEDMTPRHWRRIALKVAEIIDEEKPKGIIIAHGTDTMGYTAAALSFALRDLPIPVILVGAQRSSDRPSSDAALNLICAVTTAIKAPFAEVVVVMHGETSDTYCFAHRGTKVRKCHTSRRDAFRSINAKPLAKVYPGKVIMLTRNYIPRDEKRKVKVKAEFDEKVALIKLYPGINPEIIDFLVDRGYHGIVLEGTGLGHAPEYTLKSIKRAIDEGIAVVMTSQCLWGRINMNVYRKGVELLKMGVIPGEDMLPETAYVKLSWVLAQTRDLKEVRRLMLTNIAGEINARTAPTYYPPMEVK